MFGWFLVYFYFLREEDRRGLTCFGTISLRPGKRLEGLETAPSFLQGCVLKELQASVCAAQGDRGRSDRGTAGIWVGVSVDLAAGLWLSNLNEVSVRACGHRLLA